MKLTGLNVNLIIEDCLTSPFDEDFKFYDSITVASISGNIFTLKLSKLEKHRHLIENFFKQIDGFKDDVISFQNLTLDSNGSNWGHYNHIQHLTAMGYGLDLIENIKNVDNPLYSQLKILKNNFQNSLFRDAEKNHKLSDFDKGMGL